MDSRTYFNNYYMHQALLMAKKAYSLGEVPVGAVIVHKKTKQIAISAHNLVETRNNPLFHAEIVAIYNLCNVIKSKNLSGYDIYVTLEPCNMCAAAISQARISRLFYSTTDIKQGAVENGSRIFTSNTCFYRPEIYSGFLQEISSDLIKDFFGKIRKSSL